MHISSYAQTVILHVDFVQTTYNPYKKVYVTRAEKIVANSLIAQQQQQLSQCHYNTRTIQYLSTLEK